MWKWSFIRPIPKKLVGENIRRHPPHIALTSILAKCMERVISYHLEPYVSDHLDVLQFAYRPQRGTEDATLTMVDTIASHLQQAKSYTCVLTIEYTSAFNTRQIHLLLGHILVLGVKRLIIHWIKKNKFVSGVKSDIFKYRSTSKMSFVTPIIFFLYKWDTHSECKFENCINMQRIWHLLINVGKTKLFILNYPEPLTEIMLCDQPVEITKVFTFFGIMIGWKLNFSVPASCVHIWSVSHPC